jgi:cyclopropane fatty-acyl-phospholipid synthase-like methyltransferase
MSALPIDLADADSHLAAGESVLLDRLPAGTRRVLDLGCGDGRLLALALERFPKATGVAADGSRPTLAAARRRFAADGRIEVVKHDLREPLPAWWGRFDAVVSSFAIHPLPHWRKRGLLAEALAVLQPGGVFCTIERVVSPTEALHARFDSLLRGAEDEALAPLDVGTLLAWLREVGFDDVDCHWKRLELALLAGVKSAAS